MSKRVLAAALACGGMFCVTAPAMSEGNVAQKRIQLAQNWWNSEPQRSERREERQERRLRRLERERREQRQERRAAERRAAEERARRAEERARRERAEARAAAERRRVAEERARRERAQAERAREQAQRARREAGRRNGGPVLRPKRSGGKPPCYKAAELRAEFASRGWRISSFVQSGTVTTIDARDARNTFYRLIVDSCTGRVTKRRRF